MTRIDIFSGFLGAGKTTLIRKLIREAYKGEKLVLIENEFGEIAIDGGFLKDAGVEITEMNSGCICCTLVGDFTKALKKVMEDFSPDRIIIEPSGVGKLSDVAAAVKEVEGAELGCKLTVVDAGKCRMYMRNFGEFFNDQVENADIIVMSRTDTAAESKVLAAAELLKGLNADASLITTPWDKLDGMLIKEAMDGNALKKDMEQLEHEQHCHHHEHGGHCNCGHEHHEHHHEHGEHCSCGHEHHEHHHEHGEHCSCGHEHHGHHHEHGEHCSCGHDHHGHHHADEVFVSWGVETPKKFDIAKIEAALDKLAEQDSYGTVLRAKGFVDSVDGEWIYFDYVPGEASLRRGSASVTGRLCVIGSALNEQALKELFELD